jgi:hypothetical protein
MTRNRIGMFLFLVLMMAGCAGHDQGSQAYRWGSVYRQDVRTVSVPIFANHDFHRGVELALTKAIINHLESHTPYKVAPRERADTILEGEIVQVRVATISNTANTSIPQEQLYAVTVNFLWKDLRSGKILTERRQFEQTVPFYPTLADSQTLGSQLAVERLAAGIVQELQADW